MDERLLQKEKPSYGSLGSEEDDDERQTVILRSKKEKKEEKKEEEEGKKEEKTRRRISRSASNRSQRKMTMSTSSERGGGEGENEVTRTRNSSGSNFRRLTSSSSVSWMMANVRKFLVKYWIWIAAVMLMTMSVGGQRVVIYRVFYMFLFLTFVLTFQLSYRFWRRILFSFWILVIVYSILVLTAIYSYQFKPVPHFWNDYLKISPNLQADLGLKKFSDDEWWSLFKELLTPTFFIIITIIQLRCFHSEFMDLTADEDLSQLTPNPSSDVTRRTTLGDEEDNDQSIKIDSKVKNHQSSSSPKKHHLHPHHSSSSLSSPSSSSATPSKSIIASPGSASVAIEIEESIVGIRSSNNSRLGGSGTDVSNSNLEEKSSKRSTRFMDVPSNNVGQLGSPKKQVSIDGNQNPTQNRNSMILSSPRESKQLTRRKTLAEIAPVKIEDLKHAATDIRVRAHSLWDTAKPGMSQIYETAWKFLELHMTKVVFLISFYVAVDDVSVINFVYVLLAAITIPMGRFERTIMYMLAIWSAILVLCKMLYQLSVSDSLEYKFTCDEVFNSAKLENTTWINEPYLPFTNSSAVDYRKYVGFQKEGNVWEHVWKYLIILLILTINQVVTLRQKVHRWRFGIPQRTDNSSSSSSGTSPSSSNIVPSGSRTLASELLFPETSRKNADDGFVSSLKFLLNYGFYKFGLEVVILSMIIAIGQRMDLISVIFTLWLFIHSLCRRSLVRRIWPIFTLFVAASIPIQYLSSLGFPLFFCLEYPWFNYLDPELRNWLYLPDFRVPPTGNKIFYDFIVLLLASRQWLVFKIEIKFKDQPMSDGGSNEETFYNDHCDHKNYQKELQALKNKKKKSPDEKDDGDCNHDDGDNNNQADIFTGKSIHHVLKSYFFSGFYWITLAVVFYTATGRTNFFGLGYILGCFFFLWNGSEFYLKPLKNIARTWKYIIAYTAMVIFLKTVLHVVGCVENNFFFDQYCWISKLLGVVCKCKLERTSFGDPGLVQTTNTFMKSCQVQEGTSGLLLDGVCFLFLLAQKRIFGSYYFTYLVKDIKAQQVLASRGAELIHEIQAKEVTEQEEAERDVMEKIKAKMDRIRLYQQVKDADSVLPPERKSHRQAVRSGDYYLFDDPASEDKELDLEDKPRKSIIPDPEGDELRRIANLRGISAFMSQLLKGELQQESGDTEDLEVLEQGPDGPICGDEYLGTDVGDSSRDSAIISADREEEFFDPDASQATSVTSVDDESSIRPSTSRRVSSHHPHHAKDQNGDKDDDEDKKDDDDEDKKEDEESSWWIKIINYFYIMCWFIESCVISATAKLNHVSRDYRYVSRRLAVEKRALKLLFEMEESDGVSYDSDWKKNTLEKISRATVPLHRTTSQESFRRLRREVAAASGVPGGTNAQIISSTSGTLRKQPSASHDQESSFVTPGGVKVTTQGQAKDQEIKNLSIGELSDEMDGMLISTNAFLRLFRSLFYTIVSQSEIVCYAMVILNQLINASLLSLPLPIMVFLWGCMSVPRPSKTFWISLITYTEAVVVAKYAFNFGVWPWMDYTLWSPRVVTTEQRDLQMVNTNIDLVLLLFLFFHRFMLKTLGLWDLDEAISKDVKGQFQEEKVMKGVIPLEKEKSTPTSLGLRKRKILISDEIKKQSLDSASNDRLSSEEGQRSSFDERLSLEEECIHSRTRFHRMVSSTRITVADTTRPVKKFYHRLLHPPFRISHDLYSFMFVCDFVNFFIVVFAFNAFGSSSGESITKYFEDNKVPVPFLTMVMAQFCSMIIDRALYLRKNIRGRLLFHILTVIVIHFWLFFILPTVTEKKFTQLTPPKFWYIFKCVYLLLSAVQVKGGYPTRILGNTFTKKYSYFNLYLFKGYMLVPFLYDMRLIMDWIWTDTSLELDEWSIMEDMFKNLFQRKCELQFQEHFPEFRGFPRRMIGKYLLGGAYLVMIIGAIWFPLVIFAVGGTVGQNNRPVDVMVELEISGYVPFARMTATKVNETDSMLSAKEYSSLSKFYQQKDSQNFLANYNYQDTSLVKLNGQSTPVWGISPSSQKELLRDLKSGSRMDFKISWYISRHKQSKTQNMDLTVYKSYDMQLDNETKSDLYAMINNHNKNSSSFELDEESSRTDFESSRTSSEESSSATIPFIFPNFLRVPEKGEPSTVRQLSSSNSNSMYRNISITLRQQGPLQWFEVTESSDICGTNQDPFQFYRTSSELCDNSTVLMLLFNERIFPAGLQIISGYGIVGLYTTFVFLVSRLIRGLFDDLSFKVIYTQMPNVDKVLQLALDIYLVRESREFSLEEDLYGKLLFLYRSPETLVKWTKQIEEDQFEKQNIKIPERAS